MTHWPKAKLLLVGTCTAIVVGGVGCSKAPARGASAPKGSASQAGTATPSDAQSTLAVQLHEPPLPDPSRTDQEAVAMNHKYALWVKETALPAKLQAPALPDPSRTDHEAVAIRAKHYLWEQGEALANLDAGLKQKN